MAPVSDVSSLSDDFDCVSEWTPPPVGSPVSSHFLTPSAVEKLRAFPISGSNIGIFARTCKSLLKL